MLSSILNNLSPVFSGKIWKIKQILFYCENVKRCKNSSIEVWILRTWQPEHRVWEKNRWAVPENLNQSESTSSVDADWLVVFLRVFLRLWFSISVYVLAPRPCAPSYVKSAGSAAEVTTCHGKWQEASRFSVNLNLDAEKGVTQDGVRDDFEDY